tara:strand:- start:107 stop:1102 length:996 start_codon:yes stop_codon:yes gene_type:complete
MNDSKRIYSLDLLRGIAGYGVAICHFFAFSQNIKIFEYYSFIFVEFFFVLSGFVLSQQLLKVVDNSRNIKTFYLRRWYRTLPLYFIALLFFTVLSSSYNFDFFKYFFLIQKIIPDFVSNDYFMVSWSLAVEEFFYFLFPLYLIFFSKRSLVLSVVLFIVIFSLFKILFIDYFTSSFIRTGTLLRLDAIALGFLLSLFINKIGKNKIFIPLFIAIGCLLIFYFDNILTSKNNAYVLSFVFLSEIFSLVLVLLFYNYNFLLKNELLIKFCKHIGNQTYSVYLFHLVFLYILAGIEISFINNFFVYLLLIVIFSSLVYKFFEKPILKLRPNYKN